MSLYTFIESLLGGPVQESLLPRPPKSLFESAGRTSKKEGAQASGNVTQGTDPRQGLARFEEGLERGEDRGAACAILSPPNFFYIEEHP